MVKAEFCGNPSVTVQALRTYCLMDLTGSKAPAHRTAISKRTIGKAARTPGRVIFTPVPLPHSTRFTDNSSKRAVLLHFRISLGKLEQDDTRQDFGHGLRFLESYKRASLKSRYDLSGGNTL